MPTRLAVWVEGDRDRRFIEAVIKPRLESTYAQVLVKEYRQRKTVDINRWLRAMAHEGFGHLFIADIDSAPCVTIRKEKVMERYPEIEDQEIGVVSREIESWYLAGITANGASALNISPPSSTDNLTKQDLDRLTPPQLDSQLDFLLEPLKYFDATTACKRNKSFAHFHRMWS
ncbi:MAG: hypothetical protein ABSG03_17110 [Bryobacteraceae bacterium]